MPEENVANIFMAAPAVGRFVSRSTRDGAALSRDGQEVVEVRQLPGERPVVEVRFRDGNWMLCGSDEVDTL